jgi:hypothetical protein
MPFVERSKDSSAWRCSLSSCGFSGWGLNDFPFAQQNFPQSHFAWPRFVPDVATPLGEFLEVGNGKILATRPAQCLLPQLTFQHDRVPVEQVFFRPLHGLIHGRAIFTRRSWHGLAAKTAEDLSLLSRQL